MGTDFAEYALAHLSDHGRGQRLDVHLSAVSRLCAQYAGKMGLTEFGAALGLLHDLGKYSEAFQSYLQSMQVEDDLEAEAPERRKVDHSTAGAQVLWNKLSSKDAKNRLIAEILSLCIASHHSGLIDCVAPDGSLGLERRMQKSDAQSHVIEAWTKADDTIRVQAERLLEDPNLPERLAPFFKKLWQNDQEPTISEFKKGLLVRFLFSCLIDADRTDTADSETPEREALRHSSRPTNWRSLAERLERKFLTFEQSGKINRLRQHVADEALAAAQRPKGTFTLTVPTGGGKTLASLRFALAHAGRWEMDRIVYVSPYTSIIDQNADVIRQILETGHAPYASIVLEHHSNLTPERASWRAKVLAENWDAPIVFTTAVQFLETLFGGGTRSVRRMHALANSCIVFDEVQTLPLRTVHMVNNALNFLVEHASATVVLCTATQPLLHRVDKLKGALNLDENTEIIGDVAQLFAALKRFEMIYSRKPGGWSHDEVAELAIAECMRQGSNLTIVNTKQDARLIFQAMKQRDTSIEVCHLSTAMCPAHRLDVLMRIKKNLQTDRQTACVSTQLIEAGVDIDFATVVRDLAGLDSIAQAAGRCNRHMLRALGTVKIVNLARQIPNALVDIRIGREIAERVLADHVGECEQKVDVTSPEILEEYFRYYFFARRDAMSYSVGPDQAMRNNTLLEMLSHNRQAFSEAGNPRIYLRQSFATANRAFQAIDKSTQGVIVPYGEEGSAIIGHLCSVLDLERQFALLRRAQAFTINLYPHQIESLRASSALDEVQRGTGIWMLNGCFYSQNFGLSMEGNEDMELQIA